VHSLGNQSKIARQAGNADHTPLRQRQALEVSRGDNQRGKPADENRRILASGRGMYSHASLKKKNNQFGEEGQLAQPFR
jgi:hypothetical protein